MLARVCLAVIAAHFCIAYFGAGLAKVSSSGWRNGKSLTWTCNHGPFVVPVGRLLLKQPSLAIAISWVVIVFELGFVFSLVSGPEICLVILIVGACFHLLNSLLFGVHWFLWTFVGAYPAVWHTMRLISDAINIW